MGAFIDVAPVERSHGSKMQDGQPWDRVIAGDVGHRFAFAYEAFQQHVHRNTLPACFVSDAGVCSVRDLRFLLRAVSSDVQFHVLVDCQRHSILDVDHAARRARGRLRRSVYDQRPHGDDASTRHQAVDGRDCLSETGNRLVSQDAKRVATIQDAERSVVGVGVIEMDSERDHLFQRARRCMSVYDARLDRPRSPGRMLGAPTKGQRGVLMPHHEPVGCPRLIEVRGAERLSRAAKDIASDRDQPGIPGQRGNRGILEQMPRAGAGTIRAPGHRLDQTIGFSVVKNTGNDGVAVDSLVVGASLFEIRDSVRPAGIEPPVKNLDRICRWLFRCRHWAQAGMGLHYDMEWAFAEEDWNRYTNPPFAVATADTLPYSKTMEVRFSPEIEAKLTDSAVQQGRHPDELVQDAVSRYFDEEARFVEAVKRGEEALQRGEYLTQEQVGHRLERFLRP
jgi:predicted transcriptional regulator